MKIAYVYDAVYPWVKGGAEKRVYELAKRLAQRGHEVHWYGVGWWWPEEGQKDIELDGICLHGVCGPMELYNDDRRSIKEAIYFALKLIPRLREDNFDIIDCQGFPFFSCFTAKINTISKSTALVITLHEVWDDYWYEYLGKAGIFGRSVERWMVNLTDEIISVSEKTKKDLQRIKKSEKSVVIPNGIDFNAITEVNPSMEKLDFEKSDVMFAGRLIKEKNVDMLIKAIAHLKKEIPGIKCLIVGDGPERDNLESLTDDLNLTQNIRFTGFTEDHESLISYMMASQVFVLPSTREGFGMVILEANACGLPVVVVDHPMNAAKDLITERENGFIAELSEKSLADKILEGINKKETMKDSCMKFARGYDWDEIVADLEEFYQRVLILLREIN